MSIITYYYKKPFFNSKVTTRYNTYTSAMSLSSIGKQEFNFQTSCFFASSDHNMCHQWIEFTNVNMQCTVESLRPQYLVVGPGFATILRDSNPHDVTWSSGRIKTKYNILATEYAGLDSSIVVWKVSFLRMSPRLSLWKEHNVAIACGIQLYYYIHYYIIKQAWAADLIWHTIIIIVSQYDAYFNLA